MKKQSSKEKHLAIAKSNIISGMIILSDADPESSSEIFQELEKKLWSMRMKEAGDDLVRLHKLMKTNFLRMGKLRNKIKELEGDVKKQERLEKEPELNLIFEDE
jgi:hypothetical protein